MIIPPLIIDIYLSDRICCLACCANWIFRSSHQLIGKRFVVVFKIRHTVTYWKEFDVAFDWSIELIKVALIIFSLRHDEYSLR